jgi:hypothetical protein
MIYSRQNYFAEVFVWQKRKMLAQYIELHFPTLLPVLERETYSISDPETLQQLLVDLFKSHTVEDAQNLIMRVRDQAK